MSIRESHYRDAYRLLVRWAAQGREDLVLGGLAALAAACRMPRQTTRQAYMAHLAATMALEQRKRGKA